MVTSGEKKWSMVLDHCTDIECHLVPFMIRGELNGRIKQPSIANTPELIAITIAEICMNLQPLETQHAIQLAKKVVTKIHVTDQGANVLKRLRGDITLLPLGY
eukprot:68751_1